MSKALLLYGQIRTFKKCLTSILNFIDFNENYDVFIYIDKNNDNNYTDENIEELLNYFNKSQIKMLKYTEKNNEEDKNFENYINKCNEIQKEFNYNLIYNNFVSRLYFRRNELLHLVNDYCNKNNVVYEKCVLTRFDIRFEMNDMYFKNNINDEFLIYDIFFYGKLTTLIDIFKFTFDYFQIYEYYKNNGITELHKEMNIINKMVIENIDNYIKDWICMPEINLYLYIMNKNIQIKQYRISNIFVR
jgi:hypothetical protein